MKTIFAAAIALTVLATSAQAGIMGTNGIAGTNGVNTNNGINSNNGIAGTNGVNTNNGTNGIQVNGIELKGLLVKREMSTDFRPERAGPVELLTIELPR
jgi:hypothetical protein